MTTDVLMTHDVVNHASCTVRVIDEQLLTLLSDSI